jgi:cyclophilin family peptidyl-prolyl cis-trans isomerase
VGETQVGVALHYKGSKIHRVVHDYVLQGGELTRGDGHGGVSIYPDGRVPDEAGQQRKHDAAGLLGMAKSPDVPNSATSQFYITLTDAPLTHLDGKYALFGRVKSGRELLKYISELAKGEAYRELFASSTDSHSLDIIISDCGILERTFYPRLTRPLQASQPVPLKIIDDGALENVDKTNNTEASLSGEMTRDNSLADTQ